ncbi:MAG: SDR family oxidoreductase [Nevskiaceae bacterium]|nr:MAG: SDR family oxidoreductase [Nevskiaceae bacterium]TBR74429.1 MAG: SDR family oxidoreductase [Nevskiaceae bacterium]
MDGSAHNRVVLVTGGARRIGAAIVRRLHAGGWRVAIHCNRSHGAADALAAALNTARPDSAAVFAADLRATAELDTFVARVHARFGRLDALVNNASVYYSTPLATLTEAAFEELTGINLKAPLFLTRACLPHFGSGAAVVNVLDALALRARRHYVAYGAAKAALWTATEILAVELAPEVRVNGVAPGHHIAWEEREPLSAEDQAAAPERVPLQRLGTPEEVADAVGFLLSPQAAFLNGAVIPVDGGLRLL